MRQLMYIIVMLFAWGSACAQGWHYMEQQALIASDTEYLTGDFDSPTQLIVGVDRHSGKDAVVMMLTGECSIHDFRKSQQYVIVNFDHTGGVKWRITELRDNHDKRFSAFFITDAARFIKHLRKCESMTVTLPVYNYGITTFYFNADGYPLDW